MPLNLSKSHRMVGVSEHPQLYKGTLSPGEMEMSSSMRGQVSAQQREHSWGAVRKSGAQAAL